MDADFFSYSGKNKQHFEVSFTVKRRRNLSPSTMLHSLKVNTSLVHSDCCQWPSVCDLQNPTDWLHGYCISETCQLIPYGLLWSLLTHCPGAPVSLHLREQNSSSEKWAPMCQYFFLEWVPPPLCMLCQWLWRNLGLHQADVLSWVSIRHGGLSCLGSQHIPSQHPQL